jgi:hypothetical protein
VASRASECGPADWAAHPPWSTEGSARLNKVYSGHCKIKKDGKGVCRLGMRKPTVRSPVRDLSEGLGAGEDKGKKNILMRK